MTKKQIKIDLTRIKKHGAGTIRATAEAVLLRTTRQTGRLNPIIKTRIGYSGHKHHTMRSGSTSRLLNAVRHFSRSLSV